MAAAAPTAAAPPDMACRTPGVQVVPEAAGLSAIHDADCAAAIWDRRLDPSLATFLAGLPLQHLPQLRVVVRPAEVATHVARACTDVRMPVGPAQQALIEDVAMLAKQFDDVMRAPFMRIRLNPVTTNACAKFHVDWITSRLVCSYRGSGTQYGVAPAAGEQPTSFLEVPTGMPVVLRGTQWPNEPPSQLLHRSPPIEGTGEVRFLLVLDPCDTEQDTD